MKRAKLRYLLAIILLTAALLLGTGCQLLPDAIAPPPPSPPADPATTPSPIDPDWALPLPQGEPSLLPAIADVVARVRPSVVAISTEVVTLDIFNRPFTQQGAGSGWIIDESGIIVTNNHVVEGAETVTVTLGDDRVFAATDIKTDPLTDIAVIKIDARGLPAIMVGDVSSLRVGDWVVAIGNPLGLGISAKEGIVSRLDVPVSVSSGQTLYGLIETSAAINPGNSGGPLVNMAGEIVGITSVKISQVGVEGLGYAINIRAAAPIIEELVTTGYVTRPWLGVVLYPVDPGTARQFGLAVDQGALVTEVAPDSPAAQAGIQQGDVITGFDDEEITGADDLIQAILSRRVGQDISLTFWHGDSRETVSVTLAERPPP